MPAPDLILANALLPDGTRADVRISAGLVTAVAPCGTLPAPGTPPAERLDLAGQLLLPALVDGHAHLDKTLWGLPWRPHSAGPDRASRIEGEKRERADLPPVEQRAEALLRTMIGHGTTAVRSHVDIDPQAGLDGLHALLRLRERYRDRVHIQIVAFPQSGVVRAPGVADLLNQALAEGADLIGGIDPEGYDGDHARHLDTVFALARKHGKGVDIHLHDLGDQGHRELAAIVDRAEAWGEPGRVTVSHAFCLGEMPAARFDPLAERMAAAGVSVVTHAPGAVPMPPVKRLRAAGVRVFAGSDNIRDRWGPFGNGNMLERAMLVAWQQGYRTDPDLELAFAVCSEAGGAALGLDPFGPAAAREANLIALSATTVAEAVVARPPCSLVLHRGRIVARDGACTP